MAFILLYIYFAYIIHMYPSNHLPFKPASFYQVFMAVIRQDYCYSYLMRGWYNNTLHLSFLNATSMEQITQNVALAYCFVGKSKQVCKVIYRYVFLPFHKK